MDACQDLFQPFELLAGDPLVLAFDVGIEHDEKRVTGNERVIEFISRKVHLLLVGLLASRHIDMGVMVPDREEVRHGHRLRQFPEVRPHLAVARLFDLVAGVHDEGGLPLQDLADDLLIDIIARPIVAEHGEGELPRNLLQGGELLLKRPVLGGEDRSGYYASNGNYC